MKVINSALEATGNLNYFSKEFSNFKILGGKKTSSSNYKIFHLNTYPPIPSSLLIYNLIIFYFK